MSSFIVSRIFLLQHYKRPSRKLIVSSSKFIVKPLCQQDDTLAFADICPNQTFGQRHDVAAGSLRIFVQRNKAQLPQQSRACQCQVTVGVVWCSLPMTAPRRTEWTGFFWHLLHHLILVGCALPFAPRETRGYQGRLRSCSYSEFVSLSVLLCLFWDERGSPDASRSSVGAATAGCQRYGSMLPVQSVSFPLLALMFLCFQCWVS